MILVQVEVEIFFFGVYESSWKLPQYIYSWKLHSMDVMEAHGSLHRICSRKLQLMEAADVPIPTDSGKFDAFRWKLTLTSTEESLLVPTSMETSMVVHLLSTTSRDFPRKLIYFHGNELSSMQISLEVDGKFYLLLQK